MKRLVFIVEGNTEIKLVEKLIMPYLYSKGLQNPVNCQTITTNRKLHKKGGVVSYDSFRNEVRNTLAQGNVLVTTLIDYFKLPTDFPNYTTNAKQVAQIETAIHKDFDNNQNFIPYIQLHEVEALMFSNRTGLEFVIDSEDQMELVDEIIEEYDNPENINNSPQTAPSKRLSKIFNCDKVSDGEMIFEIIGMEAILEKCPRFSEWINTIIEKLK